MTLHFLTNVVKPWDELNILLSKPFAFQPEISDVTRLVGALAVAITHHPELSGKSSSKVQADSHENQVVSDVADAWKHGSLRDSTRDNTLAVEAEFEWKDNRFRFLRNVVAIDHAAYGRLDFMSVASGAIQYLMCTYYLDIKRPTTILEGPLVFQDTAVLFFNPKYQITMSSTKLRIVSRDGNGELKPIDPPQVTVVIQEYPKSEI